MVSEISVSEVKKAFGGDEDSSLPRMYASYRSTANAYMLMYRQSMFVLICHTESLLHINITLLVDTARNKKPIAAADIPEALKKSIEEENGAAKQKKKAEELEREMVKMKVKNATQKKTKA